MALKLYTGCFIALFYCFYVVFLVGAPSGVLAHQLKAPYDPADLSRKKADVEHYRAYLSSLLYLKPELPYELTETGHSFMLVLHVFFANLFLIFFPFSQSMHSFLSLPMNKLRRG